MSERHIDRLCAALNCKRPEPDTAREWGLRMARFSDAELDRMCAWIADNWEMARFPPVAMIRKAASHTGVSQERGTGKRFDPDSSSDCGRCNGYGLIRVMGEQFVEVFEAPDGQRDMRRKWRRLQEKPLNAQFDANPDGSPLVRCPPVPPGEGSPMRYDRLERCDCPAGERGMAWTDRDTGKRFEVRRAAPRGMR